MNSKTATEQTIASLRFSFADAHESLLLAQADCRWSDVAKYAAQLADIEAKIKRASAPDYGWSIYGA